jgi:hypothetical protein
MLYTEEITFQKTKDDDNYPVTVAEAKRHCHVDKDWNEDDDYINQLIKSVTKESEAFIQKDICYTLNDYKLYDFTGDCIELWEGNFNNLVSITTDISTALTPDHIFPTYNEVIFEWESTSFSSDPLEVKFYTGWTQPNCPEDIKLAILLRIKDYYDVHRSSESAFQVYNSYAFERLLSTYRNTRA